MACNEIELGFANLHLTPFSDDLFTKDLVRQYLLEPDRIDSADEVTVALEKAIETLVTGSGSKVIYTVPNPESGIATVPTLLPLDDQLFKLVFPDSIKTIDGAKEKTEVFDKPGILLSKWQTMVHAQFRPLDDEGNELGANTWVTFPLAIIKPAFTESKSTTPGKSELQIISIGGKICGSVGRVTGTIDLSSPIDLSTGATDKLLDITIDGGLYANINLGQNAATTGTEIIDAINTAVGFIVATIDSNNFLQVDGVKSGLTVIVDDPTSGSSAMTAVVGLAAPASNTGTPDYRVPVYVRGDETAA